MKRTFFAGLLSVVVGLGALAGCSSGGGHSAEPEVIGSNGASETQDVETSAEPEATEAAEPQDFAVESGFTTGIDSIGVRYTSAGARLTNPNVDLAAYDVQVLFNLIGGNGDVLDTTTETIPYVAPGEAVPVAPLQIGFDLKVKPTKVEVQAIGEFTEDAGPKGMLSDDAAVLKFEGAEVIRGDFGNEFSARVTNTTDAVVEYPSWHCIYLKGKKIVGGSSSTIVDPIPPGTTVEFGEMLSVDGLLPERLECRVFADL